MCKSPASLVDKVVKSTPFKIKKERVKTIPGPQLKKKRRCERFIAVKGIRINI